MIRPATVAQLVEQAIRNRQVRSSTLLGGSRTRGQRPPFLISYRPVGTRFFQLVLNARLGFGVLSSLLIISVRVRV